MILLSCVSFIIFLTGSSHAYIETSDGTGTGVMCGDHMCVLEAFCSINDTCVCDTPPYDAGNGYLKCFSSNQIGTFLLNDPILSTYDNEHANLALPCRYEMTKITTNFLNNDGIPSGICTLHVRAFNRKDKGKFYVYGYDAAIRVTFNNGTLFKMSVRKIGIANNGTYTYQINATEGIFNVDGPFQDDNISFFDSVTGLNIVECSIDSDNNIAMITITHCGICIYFRAYDVVLRRNQTQIPGLGIAVDISYGPFFISNDAVLSLIPSSQFNALTMADLPHHLDSNTVAIMYRALATFVTQNSPEPNPLCVQTHNVVQALTFSAASDAFTSCLWILQSPKFIRCFDTTTNGAYIMYLFKICTEVYAGVVPCAGAIMIITDSGCHDHDPGNTQLHSFINGEMC